MPIKCNIPYLFIDGVKFRQNNPIDQASSLFLRRQVQEPLTEFGQLINRVIAHQGLSHKQHQIRIVFVDQHRQLSHERLVILHSPRRVHQQALYPLPLCIFERLTTHIGRLFLVSPLKQRDVKPFTVRP